MLSRPSSSRWRRHSPPRQSQPERPAAPNCAGADASSFRSLAHSSDQLHQAWCTIHAQNREVQEEIEQREAEHALGVAQIVAAEHADGMTDEAEIERDRDAAIDPAGN